ncbi:MAG: hypothetical protein AAGJ35_15750, partial [Myxococcota bacterium]
RKVENDTEDPTQLPNELSFKTTVPEHKSEGSIPIAHELSFKTTVPESKSEGNILTAREVPFSTTIPQSSDLDTVVEEHDLFTTRLHDTDPDLCTDPTHPYTAHYGTDKPSHVQLKAFDSKDALQSPADKDQATPNRGKPSSNRRAPTSSSHKASPKQTPRTSHSSAPRIDLHLACTQIEFIDDRIAKLKRSKKPPQVVSDRRLKLLEQRQILLDDFERAGGNLDNLEHELQRRMRQRNRFNGLQ